MKSIALALVVSTALVACSDTPDRKAREPFFESDSGSMMDPDGSTAPDVSDTTDMGTTGGNCDGGPCPLTCDVFADPGFCWNVARAEAYACAGDFGTGTMTDGGMACVSGDVRVDFDVALTEGAVIDTDITGLQVSSGGQECAALEDTDTTFVLTTASGTVRISFEGLSRYAISCPDGSAWETTDVEGLFSCVDGEGISTLPGTSKFSAGTQWGFAILPGGENLFQCDFGAP